MRRKAIRYFGVGGAIAATIFAANAVAKDNPFEQKGAVPNLSPVLGDVVLKKNAPVESYAPAEGIIKAYEPAMSALKSGIVGASRSAHSEVTVFLSPKLAQTKGLLFRSICERLTLDGIPAYIRASAKDSEGGVTLEDWGPGGMTISGSGRFHAVPYYILSELQDLSNGKSDFSRSPIHGKAITRPSVGIRAKHPAGYLP
jgi:hypothetical protein